MEIDRSRIIFADIDGVLATSNTCFDYFDPLCVARFNRIIEAVPCVICVSSTWRLGRSVANLKDLFLSGSYARSLGNQHNTEMSKRVVGKTCSIRADTMERGKEIDDFLIQYRKTFTLDSFIILDDDTDMEPHLDRLVRTDSYMGLQDRHVDQAIDLLRTSIN